MLCYHFYILCLRHFYILCLSLTRPCCIPAIYCICACSVIYIVTAPLVTESNFPAFAVSSVNVNSFNLSTYKEGGCKTLEKMVAIMRRKSDILIITDCRLKGGVEKIKFFAWEGVCNTTYMQIAPNPRGGYA
jgi:hypothetical protein